MSETFAPPFRRDEDSAESGQLALHEQAGRRRLQVASDRGNRRVGPVRRGEGVIDVAVGELGELPGETIVVLLLFRMEPKVLQEEQLTGLEGLGLRERLGSHAVRGQRHGALEQIGEPLGHRP